MHTPIHVLTVTDPETGKVYPIPAGGAEDDPPADPPADPPTDPPSGQQDDPPPDPADDDPTPPWGSDEEFDPDKAWKLIQNLRGDIDELKPKAAKLKQIEDANKSEKDRLDDELKEARGEAATAKAEAARLKAAIKHGLSEEDLEILDGVPHDQIEERASRLAQRLAGAAGEQPVVPASNNQGGGSGPTGPDIDTVVDSIPPA